MSANSTDVTADHHLTLPSFVNLAGPVLMNHQGCGANASQVAVSAGDYQSSVSSDRPDSSIVDAAPLELMSAATREIVLREKHKSACVPTKRLSPHRSGINCHHSMTIAYTGASGSCPIRMNLPLLR